MFFALTLGGCGCFMQAQKGETPPPPPPAQVTPPAAKTEIPVPPAVPVAPPAAAQPATVVTLKEVNFDFDKYNIRTGDAETLKANFAWFKDNPGKKMRIEGNCDERGSIEYNLVLGQKRADSAKAYLVSLGADAKTMETVSYGKERPVCKEKNEECWSKNRRAIFKPVQ